MFAASRVRSCLALLVAGASFVVVGVTGSGSMARTLEQLPPKPALVLNLPQTIHAGTAIEFTGKLSAPKRLLGASGYVDFVGHGHWYLHMDWKRDGKWAALPSELDPDPLVGTRIRLSTGDPDHDGIDGWGLPAGGGSRILQFRLRVDGEAPAGDITSTTYLATTSLFVINQTAPQVTRVLWGLPPAGVISVSAHPRPAVYGRGATIRGRLIDMNHDRQGIPGIGMRLSELVGRSGHRRLKLVTAHVATDVQGRFTFTTGDSRSDRRRQYVVSALWWDTAVDGRRPARVKTTVAVAKGVRKMNATAVTRNGRRLVSVSGVVLSPTRHDRFRLQLLRGAHWIDWAHGRADSRGKFVVERPAARGTYRVRVVVRAGSALLRGASKSRTVVIR